MNLDLSGKTAVVCGSTQGLGLAAAKELALLGANIVLFARNEEKLMAALQQLDLSKNQKHSYLVADFTVPGQVKDKINNFVSQHTAQILINNTGGPAAGPALNATVEEFTQAFNSHLICNHILVQALVPGMKVDGYGRIVNIISTSVKQPIAGLGVSNTIRAAVANWSKTLATELGSFGITVNNVLPGLTQTVRAAYVVQKKAAETGKPEAEIMNEMLCDIPAKRIGQPEEFGAVVAFLCSPAASYINGINLPVDGGRLGTL
ncbi:MAG: SDR family oxidoreductase [Niastella sp.]|nr:SDR family oxidoreductase [Niastella sp.]